MAEVKLFGNWASPFSRRVEFALKLKGVEYEFIDEDVYVKKSPLLLKHNPVHKKVPVLVHNGKPICESVVILEYIDETWEEGPSILPKDPFERALARFWTKFLDEKACTLILTEGPSILPKDPFERALARFWTKFLDEKCLPAMWKAYWCTGEEKEKGKEESAELLKILEGTLSDKKFFGGDTIGMVDIVASFISYWFMILQKLAGIQVFTKEKFPRLGEWMDDYLNCNIVRENLPPKDRLTAAFGARFEAVAAAAGGGAPK